MKNSKEIIASIQKMEEEYQQQINNLNLEVWKLNQQLEEQNKELQKYKNLAYQNSSSSTC